VTRDHGARPKLAAVHVLRPIAAATAAATVVSLLAGCAGFDKAFGKQTAVVVFKDQTPIPVMLKVRAACSHLPEAIPERIPPHPPTVQMQDDIQYLISNASDAQVARLEQCLNRFPSVVGINVVTPDGS
jgi:hypothetical protein